jgi:hypothetical protein
VNAQGGCAEKAFIQGFKADNENTNAVSKCAATCAETDNCAYFTFGHYDHINECKLMEFCTFQEGDSDHTAYKIAPEGGYYQGTMNGTVAKYHLWHKGGCHGDSTRYLASGVLAHKAVQMTAQCANYCAEDEHCMLFAVSTFRGDNDQPEVYGKKFDNSSEHHCHLLNFCDTRHDPIHQWNVYANWMHRESANKEVAGATEASSSSSFPSTTLLTVGCVMGTLSVIAAVAIFKRKAAAAKEQVSKYSVVMDIAEQPSA